jgi:aminoglycoside phosphotransferase (APT) family kinase protein
VHGFDAEGREVLDFVEGLVPEYPLAGAVLSDEALRSVGRLLRAYHEATVGFVAPAKARWYFAPREPAEVICHGDFAPHNLVFRDGVAAAVIDFDTVHPGPRVWDFAWTGFCFALSVMDAEHGSAELPNAVRFHRLRVLADAYGLTAAERQALPEVTMARLRHLVDHLREQAAAGHPGFSRHVAEGHDLHYLRAVEEIDELRHDLTAALQERVG